MTFDDLDNAIDLYNSNKISGKNYFSKAVLLSRYLMGINKTNEEIIEILSNKIEYPTNMYSNVLISKELYNIIKMAERKGPIFNKTIFVYKNELDIIKSFNSYRVEKVAFILLCLYKYNNDSMFSISDIKIINYTKLGINKYDFNKIMQIIMSSGYFDIVQSKDYKIYYNISIENDGSNPCIEICDFRNVIYYYSRYFNYENISECSICGKLFLKKTNNVFHCRECANEIRKEADREYKRKARNKIE